MSPGRPWQPSELALLEPSALTALYGLSVLTFHVPFHRLTYMSGTIACHRRQACMHQRFQASLNFYRHRSSHSSLISRIHPGICTLHC
jgi:hypothetical protein